MSKHEKLLLENALNALDRLYDGDSSVVDVWALLFATCEAVRGTDHHPEFERPMDELLLIVRSGKSAEFQRDRALGATDELRHYLAKVLPSP